MTKGKRRDKEARLSSIGFHVVNVGKPGTVARFLVGIDPLRIPFCHNPSKELMQEDFNFFLLQFVSKINQGGLCCTKGLWDCRKQLGSHVKGSGKSEHVGIAGPCNQEQDRHVSF